MKIIELSNLVINSSSTEVDRSAIAAAIECPIPLTLNPLTQAAETRSLAWLREFELMDRKGLAKAAKAHLTTLVAGFYPTAPFPQLSLASDYVSWAFALDDIADETSTGERPALLARLFERLDAVLNGAPLRVEATPLELGLRDILQRLDRLATPAQNAAFVEGNFAYFGAMLWEANNRAADMVPSEELYDTFRPAAGAVPSFFALIEPLEQITLSPECRAHRDVARVMELAGKIICWTNDVLSYDKERAQGDVHNLVVVYEFHRQTDRLSAVAQAIDLINESIREFLALCEKLTLCPVYDAELARYLRVLRSVVRVTLDWTHESTRYTAGLPPDESMFRLAP